MASYVEKGMVREDGVKHLLKDDYRLYSSGGYFIIANIYSDNLMLINDTKETYLCFKMASLPQGHIAFHANDERINMSRLMTGTVGEPHYMVDLINAFMYDYLFSEKILINDDGRWINSRFYRTDPDGDNLWLMDIIRKYCS